MKSLFMMCMIMTDMHLPLNALLVNLDLRPPLTAPPSSPLLPPPTTQPPQHRLLSALPVPHPRQLYICTSTRWRRLTRATTTRTLKTLPSLSRQTLIQMTLIRSLPLRLVLASVLDLVHRRWLRQGRSIGRWPWNDVGHLGAAILSVNRDGDWLWWREIGRKRLVRVPNSGNVHYSDNSGGILAILH